MAAWLLYTLIGLVALYALADALLAAASDREERRARGGRAYAESRRYAWPTIARSLASLYEELLTPAQEYAARAGR